MKSLKQNYQKNIGILKINLKRGMTADQAFQTINSMENQLKNAYLFDDEAQKFINEMRAVTIDHFTKIKINIIKIT